METLGLSSVIYRVCVYVCACVCYRKPGTIPGGCPLTGEFYSVDFFFFPLKSDLCDYHSLSNIVICFPEFSLLK